MADIIVKIGGQLDRSVYNEFAKLKKLAQDAADAAGASGRRGGRAGAGGEIAIARQIHTEQSKLNREMFREKARQERQAAQEEKRNIRERARERMREIKAREREELRVSRELARAEKQRLREQNREAKRLNKERLSEEKRMAARERRAVDRFATRTSNRAIRFMFPRPIGALGVGRRIGYDLARGAGVDFSLGSGVARAREVESAAVALANQERIASGGKSQGAAAYAGAARGIGGRLNVDPSQVLELMRGFTGKTGAFEEVTKLAPELASMGTAAGAGLSDFGEAAGLVYNQLKQLPDAGKATIEVMRGIIGQTALGSIEMKNYTTQIGRLAAQAPRFEGSAAENVKKMSALAQLAAASGGAPTPQAAARSLTAFADTFGKPQRLAAFAKEGIDVFADQTTKKKPHGKYEITGTVVRDPLELIKDAIVKTNADIPRMAQMFMSVIGVAPVRALANAYTGAGGGEAGVAAIEKYFNTFMQGNMSEQVQAANIAERNKSVEGRAQKFQNELDRITASMADQLLPALEDLAPAMLAVMRAFTGVTTWVSKHLASSIEIAFGLAIARAGLESVLRNVIDRTMTRGARTRLGGAMLGLDEEEGGAAGRRRRPPPPRRRRKFMGKPGLGGVLGALGGGLALGLPIAEMIYSAGTDDWNDTNKATADASKALVGAHGKDLTNALVDAQAKLAQLKADKGIFGSVMDFFGAGTAPEIAGLEELIKRKRAEQAQFAQTGKLSPEAMADIAARKQQATWNKEPVDEAGMARAVERGITSRTLNVNVLSMPQPGDQPPEVDAQRVQ